MSESNTPSHKAAHLQCAPLPLRNNLPKSPVLLSCGEPYDAVDMGNWAISSYVAPQTSIVELDCVEQRGNDPRPLVFQASAQTI